MLSDQLPAFSPSTNRAIVFAALVFSLGSMAAISRVDPEGESCVHTSSDASALTCRAALRIGGSIAGMVMSAVHAATGQTEATLLQPRIRV